MNAKDQGPREGAAEAARLAELRSLHILDTAADERFDLLAQLAAHLFDTPIALVSLVDSDRQWFKAKVGLDMTSTPRDISFCTHAIAETDMLVVADATKDARFATNPLVTGELKIRFYAGAVLRGPTGQPLGTLCVLDQKPRELTEQECQRLLSLARLVEWEMRQDLLIERMLDETERKTLFQPSADVPDRRHIYEKLELALTAKPTGNVLVVLGCIDNLEPVTGEPDLGDRVLQILVQRLQKIGEGVELGFWRRTQFLIFTRLTDREKQISRLLDALKEAFARPIRIDEHDYALTATVGTSQFPEDGISARPLLQAARMAMGSVETSGESWRIGSYSPDLAASRHRQRDIAARLNYAIAEQALSVVYQPVFQIADGSLCGAEALLRWNDSRLGSVSPAEFIPVAESAGLINPIGTYVLREVLAQIQRWQHTNLAAVPISVNISSHQLRDPGFSHLVEQELGKAGVAGALLQLEVTEHALISDMAAATATLRRIAKLGVSCAVDDFGVGFSSFNYLRRLPVNTLKVDREFIMEIDKERRDEDIVAAIIAMAHALGLKVTAEGVETAAQLNVLRRLNCDHVQGFLTGRGISATEFEKLFL